MLPPITPLDSPPRGFEHSEYEQRASLMQSAMQQAGIDALLLTTEADVRYYTGFLTQFWQSPTRPWYLVIPQSGRPVAVIPSIGAACMSRTWITDIRTWSSPHAEDDGVSLLADCLQQLAGNSAIIALPMGRESVLRMPVADYQRLQSTLACCQWVNASDMLQQQRQVKSAAEVVKIRHACELASAAFAAVPDALSEGMSEIEVFRTFKQLCLSIGVDDTAYLVGASGAGGYGDIISPASARQLQAGDVLILDTGCVWDGYFCDFDRNFGITRADSEASEAYRVVWDATEAGLEFIKPGVTCAEVFSIMNAVMAPHAVATSGDVGRLGHGLGMQLTETPSFAAFDQTVIQEGMVLTLEPGYTYADGKMMVHEENIVMHASGPELLSKRAGSVLPVIG